jgi:hypothetical protein
MRIFDSSNIFMKLYLHFSYSLSMAILVLMSDRFLSDGEVGNLSTMFDGKFFLSLLVGTSLVALILYLHLPKMINRCFNIGRKFGL